MNYLKILNLNKEPFANTPDPEIFYQSRQHLGCLQKLELSIRLRRGLNVVVGQVGAGKTTICRQLIRRLARDDEFETHLIMDPGFGGTSEFLSAVAGMFLGGGSAEDATDLAVKESIKQYLFQRSVAEGRTVVLIIDEGQKMPGFGLEILREFLNYETNEHKLLQIVIFAQGEFESALAARPNFVDRINVYERLGPLGFRDTRALVRYRLEVSSNTAATLHLFSLGALWVIYRAGRGYPRKIVSLCHQCVLSLIVKDRKHVDYWLARACAGRLAALQPGRRAVRPGLAWAALVVIVSALVLGLTRSPLPEMARDQAVKLVAAAVSAANGALSHGTTDNVTVDRESGTRVTMAAALPVSPAPTEPETSGVPAIPVATDPMAALTDPNTDPAGPNTDPGGLGAAAEPADTAGEPVLPTETIRTAPASDEQATVTDVPEVSTTALATPQAAPTGTSDAGTTPAVSEGTKESGRAGESGPTAELGRVKIKAKESLSRLCWLVYGSYDQEYVLAMMEANPQLENPNRIRIGEVLVFPALAPAWKPFSAPGYWLELGRGRNLDEAMEVVRDQGKDAWPALRIGPRQIPGQGLEFAVIYRNGFKDESSARQAVDRLPFDGTAEVKVVGYRPGE